jgi:hypothetical protein
MNIGRSIGRGIEDIWERNRTEEERNRGIGEKGREDKRRGV